MIDFSTSQLTWVVIGACSIGGTGYLSMTNSLQELDKKIAVIQVKAEHTEKKLTEVSKQLENIESLLLSKSNK